MVVDGRAYSERGAAAEPLAAACRNAFIAGKDRGASRFAPLAVSVNGIGLLAARDLVNDVLLLRLEVPSRFTEIRKDDLMATAGDAGGAKARGLLKRAENLYSDLPRHHQILQAELDRDRGELDDLLAHPPGPFEQLGELTDKQAELAALTLELRLAAESPEAQAKAAAAKQRMAERGRQPGWSLLHNPTPHLVDELGYPDAAALREAVREREQAALRALRAIDVSAVRGEVEFLAVAGGRAPAGMYRVPEQALSGLDEPSQDAVIAIANSAQAVQVLDVHPGADKPAALGALAAAAHAHQRRILALPATETAADYAHTHRYADTTAAAPTGYEHLQAGRWQLPTGSLVIVDDADHLPAAQLAWLTEHAAATNTKLLLLTNPAPDRTPAHTLAAVAATHLPWAQHLGTPDPTHRATLTALEHAATHLATVTDPAIHTHTADLLARRDQLTTTYHTLAREPSAEHATTTLTRDRDRNHAIQQRSHLARSQILRKSGQPPVRHRGDRPNQRHLHDPFDVAEPQERQQRTRRHLCRLTGQSREIRDQEPPHVHGREPADVWLLPGPDDLLDDRADPTCVRLHHRGAEAALHAQIVTEPGQQPPGARTGFGRNGFGC